MSNEKNPSRIIEKSSLTLTDFEEHLQSYNLNGADIWES